ncbi:ATP-binding protein [Ferrimonas sp. SCSIO 43195]|uniref:hybrid sensor histidine kinase/response regulator n=1 Tax=Ferrimonas sp. SCSIO 43195 TaxID=2822844 RepID=UPI002075A6DD|nr:ATP-binding protein [Ferrimonas sp. SCSIO 43195]USD37075.1 response regulator [Ferrimonas sp. SCSIO 43195]
MKIATRLKPLAAVALIVSAAMIAIIVYGRLQLKQLTHQQASLTEAEYLITAALNDLMTQGQENRRNQDYSGWLHHYLINNSRDKVYSAPQHQQLTLKLTQFARHYHALQQHQVAMAVSARALRAQFLQIEHRGSPTQKLNAAWLERHYLSRHRDSAAIVKPSPRWLASLPPGNQSQINVHGQALARSQAAHQYHLTALQQTRTPEALAQAIQTNHRTAKHYDNQQALAFVMLVLTLIALSAIELIRKLRSISKLNNELARISELKTFFLATMSHEMRTPLNAISGFTDLLSQSSLSPQQREQVSHIGQASSTLLTLVNDIMDHSKLKAGKLVLDKRHFAVDELLEELHHLFAKHCRDKSLALWVHCDPSAPEVIHSDRFRLHQILCNLLSNACKFTTQGHVELRLSRTNADSLLITVTDTGIGISPEAQKHLFDAFTQADSSISRRFGGTGLGLAISHSLATLLGGELTVTSTPGAGTTFRFSLPIDDTVPQSRPSLGQVLVLGQDRVAVPALLDILRRQHFDASDNPAMLSRTDEPGLLHVILADAQGRQQWRQLKPTLSPRRGKWKLYCIDTEGSTPTPEFTAISLPVSAKDLQQLLHQQAPVESQPVLRDNGHPLRDRRILVVDDVMTNRLVAKQILTKMGATATVADGGKQAIELLQTQGFDLILLDIQMPGMDGYQTCQALRRQLPQHHGTPVIALTANVLSQRDPNLLASGFEGCITKPITREHLLSGLSRIVPGLLDTQDRHRIDGEGAAGPMGPMQGEPAAVQRKRKRTANGTPPPFDRQEDADTTHLSEDEA